MELKEILEERLRKILTNDDEVDSPLVEQVADEAMAIVGDRDLVQPFVLDIAVYRYLLIKGDMSTDAYESAYKKALKELETAPRLVSEDEEFTDVDLGVTVGQRSPLWV